MSNRCSFTPRPVVVRRTLACALFATAVATSVALAESPYFAIRVVDEQTGRGVPLVELRTVNEIRYVTDSAGYIAFHEPGLMDQEVCFRITSHGYEYPADGFGYRCIRPTPTPGGALTVKLPRVNIAERLYRVTGGGIYRDSVLLGKPTPLEHPTLNSRVLGQDSVLNTIYHGRLYWFWGDTSRPAYPLGNFQMTGATSRLPANGGLDADVGVDLDYFENEDGFTKEMAPVPGPGPTWIDGLVTFDGDNGSERMFAVYAKVDQKMVAHGRGFLEFNDQEQIFRRVGEFPTTAPVQPGGHTFFHTDGGVRFVYFTRPFPVVRVPADPASYIDLDSYECFTCLKPGCTAEEPVLDRDADVALRWAWKRDAPPLNPQKQEELIKAGKMTPTEARFRLYDAATGEPIVVHGGSVYWNDYRQRWVMIALQIFGTSTLGEVWLAEAATPLGPWGYAVKIVTHDQYSFYNPKHHPMFDQDGGRVIYFEGTYSAMFSGNPTPTPRYDYNQVMYKLDLGDPRTVLPTPVYFDVPNAAIHLGAFPGAPDGGGPAPAFYALTRGIPGSWVVGGNLRADGKGELGAGPPEIVRFPQQYFHGLSPTQDNPPPTTALLYACTSPDGRSEYVLEGDPVPDGYTRREEPLCRVWRAPAAVTPTKPAAK